MGGDGAQSAAAGITPKKSKDFADRSLTVRLGKKDLLIGDFVNDRFLKFVDLHEIGQVDCSTIASIQQMPSGGTKHVYRAVWEGRDVAVNSAKALYFINDVEYLWLMRSPYTVEMFGMCEFGPEANLSYLTPWHAFGTLERFVKKHALKLERGGHVHLRLQLALSVARGVEYFHTANPQETPFLLCDFGLWQMLVDEELNVVFHDIGLNSFVGCGHLHRPEQDIYFDMYFLGCVLTQLMGAGDMECRKHHGYALPEDIPAIADVGNIASLAWGEDFMELVGQLMANETKSAIDSKQLVQGLERIVSKHGIKFKPFSPTQVPAEAPPAPTRRRGSEPSTPPPEEAVKTVLLGTKEWKVPLLESRLLRYLRLEDIPEADCSGLELTGTVARAIQQQGITVTKGAWNGRAVAVHQARNPALFLRNLEMLAALQAPHVLKLHGHCSAPDSSEMIYITDWHHDRSLRGEISGKTLASYTTNSIIRLAAGLAGGVAAAHSGTHPKLRGEPMIMCDLDTGKVLMDGAGSVKLGILGMSSTGDCGFMDRKEHGRARDVLFLGCTFMELAGVRARCGWDNDDVPLSETLRTQLQKALEDAGSRHALLTHKRFAALVEDCLRTADERPAAADVAERLTEMLEASKATAEQREL